MRSQQRISRGKRVWTYAVRGAFIIGATALAWFHLPAAIIAICATLLVALHTKAGMLIELSFGPLRAKLERDLSEAEQLVQKLRSFAALQAGTIISAATRTGRWADAADDWQYVNLRRTEEALRHMGVSEEELKAA